MPGAADFEDGAGHVVGLNDLKRLTIAAKDGLLGSIRRRFAPRRIF